MKNREKSGSFLIELMIVISVIAFLAVLAVPNLTRFLSKAKRAEVYINLASLYAAQKSYQAEHGNYSNVLFGPEGVGWKPDGYSCGGKKEKFYYTYGFPGKEGQNFFTGKLESNIGDFGNAYVDKKKFVALAVGDINGDGVPDVFAVDENNNIVILQDAIS